MRITRAAQRETQREPGTGSKRWHRSEARQLLKACGLMACVAAVLLGMPLRSLADVPLVYDVENTGTNCTAPPLPPFGSLPFVQPFPDPFMWADWSGRSTNFSDWECHRAQIKAQIEFYEIGTKPAMGPTNVTASYNAITSTNGTLTVRVTVGTNTLTLTSSVMLPSGAGPFPAVIGMNSPSGSIPSSLFTSRNIAQITYVHNQVTTYGNQANTDPYYRLYGPALNNNNTGQYSAWAWGVSRLIDGLQLVTNTLPIDTEHICVTGCSYAGKMALFSGAFDERVALTIAQESGGGGATSWRYSHTETPGTVECVDNTDHNWFMESMFQFSGNNVYYMPEDHHELMAMCAPRALYVTGNPDYTWLSNPSCYVCSRATQQIYNTLGIPDRFGFSIVGGHTHCLLPTSQYPEVGAFLDKFLLGMTNANTSIATFPATYAGYNYQRWTYWWGTGNPIFPGVRLTLPVAATEGDGTLVGAGSVSVNGVTTADVMATLTSSDTNIVTVPDSVIIPAGQSNAVFDLTIIDDTLLNGDRGVTITATITNFASTQAAMTVHDNDSATLSVSLPASASKDAGLLPNAGSVNIGTNVVAANVTVYLTSSDPSRLTVPATTAIATGSNSAVFNLTLVNNTIIEGSTNVSVTAHVQNWTDGSSSMTILDANLTVPFYFAWSAVPSPQLIGEPFPVTLTALGATNNIMDFRLPVTLSAVLAGFATGTNSILNSPAADSSATDGAEYVMGYSFTPNTNLCVTHVRSYFGDKVSIWSIQGQLLASQNVVSDPGTWVETPLTTPVVLLAGGTYVVTTHDNGLAYYWGASLPTTFANGTIDQSFWDYGDIFPAQNDETQWYLVDLRYAPVATVSVAVSPGTSAPFSAGSWSGNVAALQAGSSMILQASAAGGFGVSNPFNVLGTPKLAITTQSNSVVLSWPTAAAGFNLYTSSDLSNWTLYPGTPSVVGSRCYVTNGLAPGRLYYRLGNP